MSPYLCCILDNIAGISFVFSILSGSLLLIGFVLKYLEGLNVDRTCIKTFVIVFIISTLLTVLTPNSTSLIMLKETNKKNLELQKQVLDLRTKKMELETKIIDLNNELDTYRKVIHKNV